mgnify:CR=1 FL=1
MEKQQDTIFAEATAGGRGAISIFRISGPRARDVLAKGCPLDLHPNAFPANACAQSLLGKIGVVIDCLNGDTFEVTAGRAYARSLWAWITGAAAEYGYKVE